MSNIAYFTTSPAMLMRKWKASSATTTTSTTTTTTTTCAVTSIDVYVGFHYGVDAGCDCLFCPDCTGYSNIVLEYSDDAGSNWYSVSSLTAVNSDCNYIDTISFDCTVTDYRLRIFAIEPCGTPVTININYDETKCPETSNSCSFCTETETPNLVGSGYSRVNIGVCQICESNCARVCCT